MKEPMAHVLAGFSPGYFAFVMATGIVSLVVHLEDGGWPAVALLWVNAMAYVLLWALTVARFVTFRRQFIEDLTHHSRGALFLTTAAATCVLGSQFAVLTQWTSIAQWL